MGVLQGILALGHAANRERSVPEAVPTAELALHDPPRWGVPLQRLPSLQVSVVLRPGCRRDTCVGVTNGQREIVHGK